MTLKHLSTILITASLFFLWPSGTMSVSPETFTTSGTFTVADGIYSVDVGCWGGGGGGGGSTKKTSYSAGGGGGGAYSKTTGIGVTPVSGYSVVVGAGGSGGIAGQSGSPGANSTFNSTLVVAVGGAGGGVGGASVGASGIGGQASSCTGDTGKKFSGGNGAAGSSTVGGGGGGGSGDAGPGSAASGQTAGTGGTLNGGTGGSGGASGGNGIDGSLFGGAGGGGGKGSTSLGYNGGAGRDGQCIITYTDTWAPSTIQTSYSPTWSFALNPYNIGPTGIGMTATTGFDYTPPIKYLFTLDNSACTIGYSGSGGVSSSWQTSTSYVNSGLQPNKCYGYKVTASDSVGTSNVGTASTTYFTYTSANTPGTPGLSSPTLTTLNLTNNANGNPASNPTTNFAVQVVTTNPTDSTWLNKWVNAVGDTSVTETWMSDATLNTLVIRGLRPGTLYGVKVKARNQNNVETPLSAEGQNSTIAPIISISVANGVISFGTLTAGTTKSTIDLLSTQVVTNNGNVAEDITIKTTNAIGGIGWTLAATSATDQFVYEFSTTAGVGWTKFAIADSYQSFITNIGVNGTQAFDLRLTAPTLSSDGASKTITVGILATQH